MEFHLIVGIFKFNIVAKIVTENRAIKAAGTIFVILFGVKNIIKIVTKPTKVLHNLYFQTFQKRFVTI